MQGWREGGGAAHADGNGVARDGYIGPVVTGLERTILETDDAGEDDAKGPRNGRCESSYRLQQATKDTDEMEMKLKVRKKKRITGAGRDAMRLGADSQMVLCGVGTPAKVMLKVLAGYARALLEHCDVARYPVLVAGGRVRPLYWWCAAGPEARPREMRRIWRRRGCGCTVTVSRGRRMRFIARKLGKFL